MIDNTQIRKIWLKQMLLGAAPSSSLDAYSFINKMGFVQIDSIPNVMRAHYHIIWSRNNQFRDHMLDKMLANRSQIFEHFTHDASLIDHEIYPFWQIQFDRFRDRISKKGYYSNLPTQAELDQILKMISDKGAMSVSDFPKMGKNSDHAWSRPAHKTGLDFLWYCGELSTSHRVNFKKYYDLTEKVIPDEKRYHKNTNDAQIDRLCQFALDRLGLGTLKQIAEFWGVLKPIEVKKWAEGQKLSTVDVELADKKITQLFCRSDFIEDMSDENFTSSMFLLNPFDPAIRDRARLNQYFGFEYKNEIFVPKDKRQYGYYVYPILYKGKFIARIELTANRKTNTLDLVNFWWEHPKYESKTTLAKINKVLEKFAKFGDLELGFELKKTAT